MLTRTVSGARAAFAFALACCVVLGGVGAAATGTKKVLFLHGGGMTGASMRLSMQNLVDQLEETSSGQAPELEFLFPDAPYGTAPAHLWVEDPPGGKEQPTTAANVDQLSYEALDDIVSAQGPFHAIAGYSQVSDTAVLQCC